MESGARGCEIVVSGKLRGQRAKAMKFVDGVMIHSGNPVTEYIQEAVRHVQMRQGLFWIFHFTTFIFKEFSESKSKSCCRTIHEDNKDPATRYLIISRYI